MSAWDELGTEHRLYDRSPIVRRAPLRWPGGKAVAVAFVVSIEYYEMRQPSGAFVPPNVPGLFGRGPYPDFCNFSRREYGNRVGVFRVMRALDAHGIRATAAIDAFCAIHRGRIVDECLRRKWEIAAHGLAVNRVISSHMTESEEAAYVAESLAAVKAATGQAPRGWHGPEYGESQRTTELLARSGIEYVLDWPNDEQPVRMDVGGTILVSLPMAVELDDVNAHWHRRITMDRWRLAVTDAVDRLARDGRSNARLLVLNLHPWLIGHPFRISYLEEAIANISRRADVWIATTGEISDWFRSGKAAS